MDERARQVLYASVGLAVLGVQRWLSVRADIEAELERRGLGPAAALSRRFGSAVTDSLGRLAGAAGPSAAP